MDNHVVAEYIHFCKVYEDRFSVIRGKWHSIQECSQWLQDGPLFNIGEPGRPQTQSVHAFCHQRARQRCELRRVVIPWHHQGK